MRNLKARKSTEWPAKKVPGLNSDNVDQIAKMRKIFSTITTRYDLMNHLLSAGRDIGWRRFAVRRLVPDTHSLLDLATGTADVALEAARHLPDLQVCGIDLVPEMLKMAKQKISCFRRPAQIRLIRANALHLPFPDRCFDAAIIAFGMRNIPDHERLLREMGRVVKKGGRLLILEMTFPQKSFLARLLQWYLLCIVPLLGTLLAGNRKAYRYLSESIHHFMAPEELSVLLSKSGYESVRACPLTGGIAYLHEAMVP